MNDQKAKTNKNKGMAEQKNQGIKKIGTRKFHIVHIFISGISVADLQAGISIFTFITFKGER